MISLKDFQKADLRVGRVLSAEAVPESNKLLKLSIDFGPEIGQRTIMSGIKKQYAPEALVGRQIVAILNLEPRKIAGSTSEGMVLSAESEQGPVLIVPLIGVLPGSCVH